jgi:hypothetical protein
MNNKFFGGALTLEFVVLPPEEGTFLAQLRVLVLGVGALVLGGPFSEFGSGLVHGLTGKHPFDLGSEFAAWVPDALGQLLDTDAEEAAKCQAGAMLAVSATKLVLASENDYLRMIGVVEAAPEVLEAKRRFYDACLDVPDLRAVGFDRRPHFPVGREDFKRMRENPPKEDEPEWELATEYIKVTSPNWNRDDNARTWKAMDREGSPRVFRILDEAFWGRIIRGELETRINDSMRVQWMFQRGPHGPKNHRVLSVLEFNGVKVSAPKSDEEIRSMVSRFIHQEVEEPSLFGDDD